MQFDLDPHFDNVVPLKLAETTFDADVMTASFILGQVLFWNMVWMVLVDGGWVWQSDDECCRNWSVLSCAPWVNFPDKC